jgi:hypothetical protein
MLKSSFFRGERLGTCPLKVLFIDRKCPTQITARSRRTPSHRYSAFYRTHDELMVMRLTFAIFDKDR